MDIQTATFIVGLILGTLAVGSACYVWVLHRAFGVGGGSLSVVGFALVGLSIWSSVKIQVSEGGLQAEFQRLSRQVQAVAQANETVTQEVKKIGETTEIGKRQFVELTRVLEAQQVAKPNQLENIRRPILTAPTVDVKRLDKATRDAMRVR
ncbi:MAG TPA: hypothetical protein VGL70_05185 [Candidatus Binatia bacterium]|jgi:hypothetical protein